MERAIAWQQRTGKRVAAMYCRLSELRDSHIRTEAVAKSEKPLPA